MGARSFLPEAALPYFGLIPLALGLYAAWRTWRNRGDDEAQVAGKQVGVLTVAAVTFANGGDNIGVYVPVLATASTTAIIAYCLVFLALVASSCSQRSTSPPADRSPRLSNVGNTSSSRWSSSA